MKYPFAHHKDAIREVLSNCHIASQFGHILKKERIHAGYSKPATLSLAFTEIFNIEHSVRSIYRYESGLCSPSIDFLVAASLLISPELFPELLRAILSPTLVGDFRFDHGQPIDCRRQLSLFPL